MLFRSALGKNLDLARDNLDQSGVVSFATTSRVLVPLTRANPASHLIGILALGALTPDGATCLGCGIEDAQDELDLVRRESTGKLDWTGFSSSVSLEITPDRLREMIRAGAAGLHIEDQVAAKRCGHRPGKALVSTGEMVDRIKAAVDSRSDPSFVIIARTDAVAVEGLDAARRGQRSLWHVVLDWQGPHDHLPLACGNHPPGALLAAGPGCSPGPPG